MKTTAACPSDFALERFLLGELPREAAEVAAHIDGCEACQAKVSAKRADDGDFTRSAGAASLRRALSEPKPARADDLRGEHRERAFPARRSILTGLAVAAAIAVSVALSHRRPPSATTWVTAKNDEETVLRVQREWMEAIRDKNAAALDRILADDYTFTDSRGRVSTKEDSLRQARASGARMKAFHASETKAQVHGDLAVITGRVRIEGESGGEPYDAELRFTDILARIDGQWRAVAAHMSRPSAR
jgi:ketosteroid isomerase-like protein